MLQASSQYLRPDYLAAPTAIDTKSSPLALLAQTCSAIGADTTNPKLLAANIEKATKAHKSSSASSLDNRDKSSPLSSHSSVSTGSAEQQLQHQPAQQQHQQHHPQQPLQPQPVKCSFKPYETNNNHIRERSIDVDAAEQATNLTQAHAQMQQQHQQQQQQHQRVKTPKISNNGSTNGRCDSNQSASSQRGESPAINGGGGGGGGGSLRRTPSSVNNLQQDLQQQQRALNSPAHHHPQQQQLKTKELNLNGGSMETSHSTTATTTSSPSQQSSAAATSARLQASNEAAALAQASKEASYMKALQAAAAASGGSASSASAAYYPGYPSSMPYPMDLMTASALMSPHHPMFKAASLNPYLNYARLKGLEMQPNICRDPYCTGCPSSPHFLNKAAGQPCPAGCPQCEREGKSGSSAAAAAAASSYHAQLAALAAASQMPYVCSWIGGDTPYCGKRFATSDELFQHLRTHTASLPESVLTAAAQGGIPPNHPLFQRTYPTPPLSPLSAARYHPYGKPSMLPPSLAAAAAAAPPGSLASLQMQQHPALAQYFSPYSLYGPRMGSSHP